MASIIPVGDKWRAQVRRKGYKPQTRTFSTKKDAEAWARRIESGIDESRAEVLGDDMTVAALIGHYRRLRTELGRPIEPTTNTEYMLRHLDEDLGPERVRDLTPQRLAKWARERHGQGAGGYTVNMELSALGTAIRHTASFLGVPLPDVVGAARPLLHYGQLISGGNKRTRKPEADELARLLAWLRERNPIVGDAVHVAAITGMRRGEIARVVWSDVDELRRAVLVRQRKHPRRIEARDEWVPLLGDAWDIVKRQARTDARIFPVSRETLTDSVTAGARAARTAGPASARPAPARYVCTSGTWLRRRRPEGRDGASFGRGALAVCGGVAGVSARAVRRCSRYAATSETSA